MILVICCARSVSKRKQYSLKQRRWSILQSPTFKLGSALANSVEPRDNARRRPRQGIKRTSEAGYINNNLSSFLQTFESRTYSNRLVKSHDIKQDRLTHRRGANTRSVKSSIYSRTNIGKGNLIATSLSRRRRQLSVLGSTPYFREALFHVALDLAGCNPS